MNIRIKKSVRLTLLALLAASTAHVGLSLANTVANTVANDEPTNEPILLAQAMTGLDGAGKSITKVVIVDAQDSIGHLRFSTDSISTVEIDKVFGSAMNSATINMLPNNKSIKNAPYSAEIVTLTVQNLPDGNSITRTTRSLSYRDSAGRTRQD